MKRIIKGMVLPGLISLGAGIVLAAVLILGFREEIEENQDQLSFTSEGLRIDLSGKRENRSRKDYTYSCFYDFTDEGPIHEINFEIAAGVVNITTGDAYSVKVTDMEENAITSTVKNGIWYMEDTWMKKGLIEDDYCPKVTIVIPKDVTFDEIKIRVGAGTLYAEELSADKADITVGTGELHADKMTVSEQLEIDNGVGDTRIDLLDAKNLTVDNGVGSVSLCGAIHGKNKITCGVGEVTVTLTDREAYDFEYSVDCGIGSVRLGSIEYQDKAYQENYSGKDDDSFDLNCGIGRIELKLSGDR